MRSTAALVVALATAATAQIPPQSVVVATKVTTANSSLVAVDNLGKASLLTKHDFSESKASGEGETWPQGFGFVGSNQNGKGEVLSSGCAPGVAAASASTRLFVREQDHAVSCSIFGE